MIDHNDDNDQNNEIVIILNVFLTVIYSKGRNALWKKLLEQNS